MEALKMINFKKVFYTLSLVFILEAVSFGVSYASLMLRQPSINLFLKQGQTSSGGVILENVSDNELLVSAESIDSLDKSGNPEKRSSAKMIKLINKEFVIPPKSVYDLRYTVDIPKNAKGGYWSSIIYSYSGGSVKGPEDMTFNFKMHIEAPVNISILNTDEKKISIDKFDVQYIDGKYFEIKSKIKNTGNIFEEIKPSFIILDAKGKIIASFKSNTFKAYPEHEYVVNLNKEMKVEKGKIKLVCFFDFGGENIPNVEKEIIIN